MPLTSSPSHTPENPLSQRVQKLALEKLKELMKDGRFDVAPEIEKMILEEKELYGEGNFWIIIESQDPDIGLKVFKKPDSKKEFAQETDTQEKFYTLLEKGKEEGVIPEYICIPEVLYADSKYGHPAVQLIKGNSLLWILNKKRYKKELKLTLLQHGWKTEEMEEAILCMTDFQVQVLLESYGMSVFDIRERIDYLWFLSNSSGDTYIWGTPFKYWVKLPSQVGWALAQAGLPISAEQLALDLEKIEKYFEQQGYFHKDLLWGNIMVGKNGKVYIIDFGVSEITKNLIS